MMTISEFEDLIDRFGGEPARWPADLRHAADVLLAVSDEARLLKADMDRVETYLRVPAEPSATVQTMASVAMRQRQVGRIAPIARRAGWGTGLAAALALGMFVGSVQVDHHTDNPDEVLATALDTTGSIDVD